MGDGLMRWLGLSAACSVLAAYACVAGVGCAGSGKHVSCSPCDRSPDRRADVQAALKIVERLGSQLTRAKTERQYDLRGRLCSQAVHGHKAVRHAAVEVLRENGPTLAVQAMGRWMTSSEGMQTFPEYGRDFIAQVPYVGLDRVRDALVRIGPGVLQPMLDDGMLWQLLTPVAVGLDDTAVPALEQLLDSTAANGAADSSGQKLSQYRILDSLICIGTPEARAIVLDAFRQPDRYGVDRVWLATSICQDRHEYGPASLWAQFSEAERQIFVPILEDVLEDAVNRGDPGLELPELLPCVSKVRALSTKAGQSVASLLRDKEQLDPDEYALLVETLGVLGHRPALPLLREHLEHQTDPLLRACLRIALLRLGDVQVAREIVADVVAVGNAGGLALGRTRAQMATISARRRAFLYLVSNLHLVHSLAAGSVAREGPNLLRDLLEESIPDVPVASAVWSAKLETGFVNTEDANFFLGELLKTTIGVWDPHVDWPGRLALRLAEDASAERGPLGREYAAAAVLMLSRVDWNRSEHASRRCRFMRAAGTIGGPEAQRVLLDGLASDNFLVVAAAIKACRQPWTDKMRARLESLHACSNIPLVVRLAGEALDKRREMREMRDSRL